MIRSFLVGSVALLALSAVACGGGGDTTPLGSGTAGAGAGDGSTGTNSGTGTATTGSSTTSTTGSNTTSTSTSTSSVGGGSTTATSTGSGKGGAGGAGVGGAGAGGNSVTSSSAGTGGDPNAVDKDGDGWSPNDGDCNDGDPLTNPGAFEKPGDGIDNDCDPSTKDDAAAPDCSPPALMTPTSASDLAKAMELCQFTTANPPLAMKKWGVISAVLTLADGSSNPKDVQVGVLGSFGPNVKPKVGPVPNLTMAALSSGTARALGDPGYVHPSNGPLAGQIGNYNAMTQVSAPASYLAAHGGKFPTDCINQVCNGGNCSQAYDSSNLTMQIRVPTNALSFSYNLKFYSAEYPKYLCPQIFNDFFVTLLKSAWVPDPNVQPPQQPIPADGDIAFDSKGNPVSVNNALFTECFPAGMNTCPSGTLGLIGNGMGGWNLNEVDAGGGTDWLTNDSPVVPGETITIQFIIWDAADHNVDSLILLDSWKWKTATAAISVHS